MSAAVYVNATRATMLSLFGKGGLQLQSQLAAWFPTPGVFGGASVMIFLRASPLSLLLSASVCD